MRFVLPILATAVLALAHPAQALQVDLIQVGGTATGGSGSLGDTVSIEVIATLDASDGITALFPTLQWDIGGGNVLDIVSASEPALQVVEGLFLTPLSPVARVMDVDDRFSSVLIDINDPVYPTQTGPAAFFGLEQVLPPGGPALFGPATFSVGIVDFVLSGSGSTTISFLLGGPWATAIADEDFNLVEEEVELGSIFVGSFSVQAIPEPSTASLLALGLVGIAAMRRQHAN